MTEQQRAADESKIDNETLHELLLRLDLATEVLEGLDELGLDTRAEVQELLTRLESQIADAP